MTGRLARRQLALTIDDNPDLATTPALLDLLARCGECATFFAIGGRMRGADWLLARVRREGHEVGDHFTSGRPSITLDSVASERDVATDHRPGSGCEKAWPLEGVARPSYVIVAPPGIEPGLS